MMEIKDSASPSHLNPMATGSVNLEDELSRFSGDRVTKLKQVGIKYSVALSPHDHLSLLTAEGRQGNVGVAL